jgi:type IX secretion system substrate protein
MFKYFLLFIFIFSSITTNAQIIQMIPGFSIRAEYDESKSYFINETQMIYGHGRNGEVIKYDYRNKIVSKIFDFKDEFRGTNIIVSQDGKYMISPDKYIIDLDKNIIIDSLSTDLYYPEPEFFDGSSKILSWPYIYNIDNNKTDTLKSDFMNYDSYIIDDKAYFLKENFIVYKLNKSNMKLEQFFDLNPLKNLDKIPNHNTYSYIQVSPDEKYLVYSSNNVSSYIEIESASVFASYQNYRSNCTFSNNSKFCTHTFSNELYILSTINFELIYTFSLPYKCANVDFLNEDSLLVDLNYGCTLIVDLNNQESYEFIFNVGRIHTMLLGKEDEIIFIQDNWEDGILKITPKLNLKSLLHFNKQNNSGVGGLNYNPILLRNENELIFAATNEVGNYLVKYNYSDRKYTPEYVEDLSGFKGSFTDLVEVPNSNTILASNYNGKLYFYDHEKAIYTDSIDIGKDKYAILQLSNIVNNEIYIVTAYLNEHNFPHYFFKLFKLNLESKDYELIDIELHGNGWAQNERVFSADNRYLFNTENAYTLDIWDLIDNKIIKSIDIGNNLLDMAISPNGKYLACGGDYYTKIIDLNTFEELYNITDYSAFYKPLTNSLGPWHTAHVFDKDSKFLYIGNQEGDIIKFDLKATSVEEILSPNKTVKVYPNPSNEHITIKSVELFDNISVYDYTGRKILSKKVAKCNSYELDISQLSVGFYSVRLLNGDKINTQSFIKK